jgi:hypothetical protein
MKIKNVILIFAFCMLAVQVMADPGVPQTSETQGFLSSTDVQVTGTITEQDSLVWRITNDGFSDQWGGVDTPLFGYRAALYSMAYSEDTIADQGVVTYTKQGSVDTQGKVEGQSNVKMEKIVEFEGLATGRMISGEEQVLDGAGTPFPTYLVLICPFAQDEATVIPTFCNIVQEGSAVDLTYGSLATQAADRFVTEIQASSSGWDNPVSDYGVTSDYQVRLTGLRDVPAFGSADAYMNVHVQEAAGFSMSYENKSEDLVYSEDTTASGEITLFQKVMDYSSKFTGHGPVLFA